LKAVRKQIKDELLPALAESDDDRAASIADALSGRQWDLESAAAIAAGTGRADGGTDLLDAVLRIRFPEPAEVEGVASELESALARLAEVEESEAGRSRRSVDLLETALAEHADHGDQACPVCGAGRLDTEWRQKAETQIEELRRRTAAYDEAAAAAKDAHRRARGLVSPVPPELSDLSDELDGEGCRRAWERWAQAPDAPGDLAGHLR